MSAPSASGLPELVFLDTETTSLRPDRRVWEIGAIHRVPGLRDEEYHWFIDPEDCDLAGADPFSLNIGGYWRRHPRPQPRYARGRPLRGGPEREAESVPAFQALGELEQVLRGAHVIGAVPNFDDHVLSTQMRGYGIAPTWHYHLIDIEPLIIGWLAGQRAAGMALRQEAGDLCPPWNSDQLSRSVGVEPPGPDQRHTALGDARWVRQLWDAITGPVFERPAIEQPVIERSP